MNRILPALLLLASGCKVVDAPEDFDDLMVFAFVEFETSQAHRVEASDALTPFVDTLREELEQGYRVDSLQQADIVAAGIDAPEDAEVVGVAANVTMTSSVDEVATVMASPLRAEAIEALLEFRVLEEFGDLDCFLQHECASYRHIVERVTTLGLFGQGTQRMDATYYWVTLADGQQAMFLRSLAPDEMEITSGLMHIYQNYTLTLFFEDNEGRTNRLEGNWIDAEVVGLNLPASTALNNAVGAMQDQAEQVDAWVEQNL